MSRLVLIRPVLSRFAALLLALVLTSDLVERQSKVPIAVGGGGGLCTLPDVLALTSLQAEPHVLAGGGHNDPRSALLYQCSVRPASANAFH